ncbi:MAG TPA: sigma-54-dependent Fis family transcriptional regulator [Caldithrix abyssi]|uniref:Sigma-54-dependent Fis family transcriptional regulator n=1 Tax=Caldithrix abyssi TaxID=187145 RepID=A0A7V1LLX3_CALAY|nr:sigma-54-dependent Fis family transcriptional regulator [Caldithrix abyssi]
MSNRDRQVLIIDDNETMLMAMSESLEREGYRVTAHTDAQQALEQFKAGPFPLVITDLRMAPLDGLAVLNAVKAQQPLCEVLLISAYGNVEKAVEAMRLGAADFLTKPFSNEELRVRVDRLFEKIEKNRQLSHLEDENRYLTEELESRYAEMIGRSPAMKRIYDLIRRVASDDSAVLIEGESGTGKELVARAIHQSGKRADKPFIRVNCGALNDNLLESELFGHEKGAFTGAIRQRKGRFELADGGTLFLDEVSEISPHLQVKLLRAVQQKEFERVGGEETLRVDIRIVAASNRKLLQEVHAGTFREDLYYRLNIIPVTLPPLRERAEDIPLLAEYFLQRLNRQKKKNYGFSDEALKRMMHYAWPGNIRELENMVERLVVISPEAVITAETIDAFLGGQPARGLAALDRLPLDEALAVYEKRRLEEALEQCGHNRSQTARTLGIKTSALYYKLEKYGLL